MDDAAKKLVLARRARFMAAAMAGVAGVAAASACAPEPCLSTFANPPEGGVEADAQPCLSVIGDSGNDATPQPCLEPLPPDAGDAGDAGDAADGGDAGDAGDGG